MKNQNLFEALNNVCNYIATESEMHEILNAIDKDNEELEKSTNKINYSEKFKELRKNLNLTQKELSEGLGLTQAAISKIEKGERNPSTNVLYLICETFKIPLDFFNIESFKKNKENKPTSKYIIKFEYYEDGLFYKKTIIEMNNETIFNLCDKNLKLWLRKYAKTTKIKKIKKI